ncbi:signal transduction histidine kinase [Kitasatospora gansuensis]|uniref:histidine kinase n=2 Tax=Kitasatospora gansuensis TaxID=258050 RepID=A0A7W7WEV7_9ACTN|nr:signal transduction histidine kinase [Kitasatospora gansuensis]
MNTAPTRRWLRAAALPAAALTLTGVGWADLDQHYALDAGAALALSVARALPLLWSRTRPLLAFGVSAAAVLLTAVLTRPVSAAEPWPMAVTSLAALVALLVLAGSRVTRRACSAMGLAVPAGTAVLIAVLPGRGSWSGLVPVVIATGLALIAAEVLRDRALTRARLVEQEQISELERTKRALLEERARIGRELHDVVAHHMSLIAVRAETAPYRLPDCAPEVREEFRAVSGAARDALTDMRRLLGLLRGEEVAARVPQPELSQLAALVRESGDGATLEVVGELDTVPATIGVCAYRIVQESLSNARRHALGAAVDVRLHRTAASLRITVRNGPGAAPSSAVGGDGHGLMGMRERVAVLDGEFSAGAGPDGGFTVTADLPLPVK